jgi:uncharacterized membrane protein
MSAKHVKLAHASTLISLLTLLFFFAITTYLARGEFPLATVLAIIGLKMLPLLAFLPGLIQGNIRTHSWLCFVLLIYFIFAVLTTTQHQFYIQGFIFIFLTVELFISAMMFVKWKKALAAKLC